MLMSVLCFRLRAGIWAVCDGCYFVVSVLLFVLWKFLCECCARLGLLVVLY